MTPSALINKSLRKHVAPVLKSAGFEKVDWKADCVWVFNIRAVGSYFSEVTGWPPSSVCVWLGLSYDFIPQPDSVQRDALGRVRPAEHLCQLRSKLQRRKAGGRCSSTLRNPGERNRRDIWWLEPDGSDADEVAIEIAQLVTEDALPWYTRCTNLELAFADIETERDCLNKYVRAAYLAKRLKRTELAAKYAKLAKEEGERIGRPPDLQL
jgi:hypothetical protein